MTAPRKVESAKGPGLRTYGWDMATSYSSNRGEVFPKGVSYGHTGFSLPRKKTSHVRIRVSARVIHLLRKHRSGVPVTLTAAVGGKTVTQTIALRIF